MLTVILFIDIAFYPKHYWTSLHMHAVTTDFRERREVATMMLMSKLTGSGLAGTCSLLIGLRKHTRSLWLLLKL